MTCGDIKRRNFSIRSLLTMMTTLNQRNIVALLTMHA